MLIGWQAAGGPKLGQAKSGRYDALTVTCFFQCRLERCLSVHDGLGEFRGIIQDSTGIRNSLVSHSVIAIYGVLPNDIMASATRW